MTIEVEFQLVLFLLGKHKIKKEKCKYGVLRTSELPSAVVGDDENVPRNEIR